MNQQYLSAELARIGALLDPRTDDNASVRRRSDAEAGLARARAAMERAPAIDTLSDALGLTQFERDVLLLCAGVELQSTIARRCGAINGHDAADYATFAIALGLFDTAHWSALAPDAPLRRWLLISITPDLPLTSSPVRIEEWVLHYLVGLRYLDRDLEMLVRVASPATPLAPSHRSIAEAVAAHWLSPVATAVVLHGNDPEGQADIAQTAAAAAGWPLYVLRAEDIPVAAAERTLLARRWMREAILLQTVLLVCATADTASRSVADFVDRIHTPVVVSAPDLAPVPNARTFRVNRPSPSEQRWLWEHALSDKAPGAADAIRLVAGQVGLSARTIATAGATLAADGMPDLTVRELLHATVASRDHRDLDELAERIDPAFGWADLVLPEDRLAILHELAMHVRHRATVYEDWGFGAGGTRGLGITALFAGGTGTGKTMAAEVLANDLGLELYRIDLSSVVSKYIGETEKHLRRVFDAADHAGAILLFDEADALFGKRSEVRDSHDRYANIEVSYLLQRMDAYRGLAILTTNAKAALDRAFYRRLRFVVAFPFPDLAHRERIWRSAFPDTAPTEGLDYSRLARLHMPGGAIRNIAILAAFRAADTRSAVTMAHLASATRTEMAKVEKTLSPGDTRDWA